MAPAAHTSRPTTGALPTPGKTSRRSFIVPCKKLKDDHNMSDQNLYVLEVRNGTILYLNERTPAADGWHWGTDDAFVRGPFASSELALADARRHCDQELKLLILNEANILDDATEDPPPSGHIIVVDTGSCLWVKKGETPS